MTTAITSMISISSFDKVLLPLAIAEPLRGHDLLNALFGGAWRACELDDVRFGVCIVGTRDCGLILVLTKKIVQGLDDLVSWYRLPCIDLDDSAIRIPVSTGVVDVV